MLRRRWAQEASGSINLGGHQQSHTLLISWASAFQCPSVLNFHPSRSIEVCFKTAHRYRVLQRIGGQEIPSTASSTNADVEKRPVMTRMGIAARFRPRILIMGVLVSMGGFIFGYDTGSCLLADSRVSQTKVSDRLDLWVFRDAGFPCALC